MKKLILILLLAPFIAQAQITPAQDTTLITGSAAFTPQTRYTKVTLDGVSYRIPQVYNSILGKYDTYVTTKYLRAFYAPLVGGGYAPTSRLINTGYGLLGGGDLSADRTLLVDTTNLTSKTFFNTRIGTATSAAIAAASVTYSAGFGMGLTGNTFRVDTTLIGSKSWANSRFRPRGVSPTGNNDLALINSSGELVSPTGYVNYRGVEHTFQSYANWQFIGDVYSYPYILGGSGDQFIVRDTITGIHKYIPGGSFVTPAQVAASYQPINAKLTSFSALPNALGVLTNNGSGVFSYTIPSTGTVTSLTDNTVNGVAVTWANRTTTPTPTVVLGAITPTSTNGVTATTMAFNDATSSIQTQLNGKQPTGSYALTSLSNVVQHSGVNGVTPAYTAALNTIEFMAGYGIGSSTGSSVIFNNTTGANKVSAGKAGQLTINANGFFLQTSNYGAAGSAVGLTTKAAVDTVGFVLPLQTANTVPYLDANKRFVSSAVTPTQLSYLDATSSIQTQLNAKQNSLGFTPENVSNKATTYGTINNTLYPSIKLVSDSTLHPNNNLSDLVNKTVTRTNLGLAIGVDVPAYNDSRINNGQTAFGWGNHAGLYPTYTGGGASGTWNISVLGNAATVTNIGALTGDVGSVNRVTTLATVNSNIGTFGSSTAIPTVIVNPKGLITGVSTNAVIAPAVTLTGTTLASNVVTSSLTSAAGGTFGSNAFNSTPYLPLTGGILSGPLSITKTVGSSSSANLMLNTGGGGGAYGNFFSSDASHGLILRGYPANGTTSDYSVTPTDVMSFVEYGGEFRFYRKDGSLTLNGKIDNNGFNGALANGVIATTQASGKNNTTVGTTGYTDAAITALKVANNNWTGLNTYSLGVTMPGVNLTGGGANILSLNASPTTVRSQSFQDKSGAIALTSDIVNRTPLLVSSNATMVLNSDYLNTSATQYTLTLPSSGVFTSDGSKIITILSTGTGGVKVSVPSGYSMQSGTSFATTTGTGGATLTQGQKVQLIAVGTNSYYLQPLNGTVTLY